MAKKPKHDKQHAPGRSEHDKDKDHPAIQPSTKPVARNVKEALSIVKWLALDDEFLDRVLQVIPAKIQNHESTKFLADALDKNISNDNIPAILEGILDLLDDMDCFSHVVVLLAEFKNHPAFIRDIKDLVPF
nr:hypothetical protein [Candidatus Sigynarchaeota archaeon]